MSNSLQSIARALVASGKGILAADESTGTIGKRFEKIGIENTEENRRAYRELLFTAPGMSDFISGVILYDETIRQKSVSWVSFVEVLQAEGVIPGIKVDAGTVPLPFSPSEKITEGLDGLRGRFAEYCALGARFAKWRAVILVDEENSLPTENCLRVNAHALARYAALAQEAGLVPIVEPEVLMDGSHGLEECFAVTSDIIEKLFIELRAQGVALDGMLLKPNMVIPGEAAEKATPEQIAEMTIRCLHEVVPQEVPGIVFLSGGQSEEEACINLNAIVKAKEENTWALSFSYGRALQTSVLSAWGGKPENIPVAEQVFFRRAQLASLATEGKYIGE